MVPAQIRDNSSQDLRCRGCKKLAGSALPQSLKRQAIDDESDLRRPMPAGATYEKIRAVQSRVEAGVATPVTHTARADNRQITGDWAAFVEASLVEFFEKAMATVGQPVSQGAFALVLSGSLARQQATPFSDLEFFIVVNDVNRIGAFRKVALEMWKLIGAAGGNTRAVVSTQRPAELETGSLTEDAVIHSKSQFIVLTPKGQALDYKGVSNVDAMPALKDGMFRNFVEAGRPIAGTPNLFLDLRKAIAEACEDARNGAMAFEKKIREEVTAEYDSFVRQYRTVRIQKRHALVLGAPVELPDQVRINIKDMILRPILFTTLTLGRFYGVLGPGSLEHAVLLAWRGVISQQVLNLIVATTDYAQSLRLRLHTRARQETDEAPADHPVCKACMRNISALMGMADIWIKKHNPSTPLGAPTRQESRRDAFRTTRPLSYDKYNLSLICGTPGANNQG
jgi:hypothetical protein